LRVEWKNCFIPSSLWILAFLWMINALKLAFGFFFYCFTNQ
jgi:hypothetical protein